MFNDFRKLVELRDSCSYVLTYPQIENYPNPDLKKRDDSNDIIISNYYVEPYICVYN